MARTLIGRLGGTEERPAIFFTGPEEFRAWLERHHDTAPELWMGLYKRHVEDRGLTWEAAVPEALAFGWIDSKSERIDDCAHGRLIKSQAYGDPPRWQERAAAAAHAART